jgi:hypothetical protein
MKKSHEKSIFTRFHSNSRDAKEVFNNVSPNLDGKPIEVLQVQFLLDNKPFDVVLEFIYKKDK